MARFISILALGALLACSAAAQQKSGHPDLSGLWAYAVDQPAGAIKQTVGGEVTITAADLSGRRPAPEDVAGSLPFQERPSYKPEHMAKVRELEAKQSRTDGVFYCGRPGVPRLGPPRKIVQSPGEMIFLYEDMSGDTWRIVPIVGSAANRKHDPNLDPTYNGDPIGWWEGDRLVVESANFVEDTWFGELGYFHSERMTVTERIWLYDGKMAYQVTVDDPVVLAQPWTMAPRLIERSDSRLLESPVCVDFDGPLLANDDHHGQR